MITVPQGKTIAIVEGVNHDNYFKVGDKVYIDGYCRGADHRPYAIVVRIADGKFDMISAYALKVTK